jgi:hypothetical protein
MAKKASLPRDPEQRSKPAYPQSIEQGSTSPEGYQKEARAHKPSSAGTKLGLAKGPKV